MIKLTIIKTNHDWLEATWTENEAALHCESDSGHKEHIELLKNKCIEFDTKLDKEQLKIIDEISKAFVYPDENETLKEIEGQRILSIKSKAKELIEKQYPIYKQNNILMSGISVDIKAMNDYIFGIRVISNEAEANGISLENIDWKL